MNLKITILGGAFLAATFAWTAPVLAQTTPEPPASAPAAATTAAPPTNNEVVTLQQFDVTASGNDYIASEDLSGSRLAGKIVEEPFDIQSVTKQFINDFDLVGAGDEALSFIGGFVRLDSPSNQGATGNNGRILGFDNAGGDMITGVLWDGISHYGYVPDVSMIDGVEMIKGPEAALYGDTEPGGMTNYIMRRPSTTPTYDLSYSTGTYDFNRIVADASGPLWSDKLYYLAVVSSTRTEENSDYVYYQDQVGYFRLLYKPTPNTTLIASFETLHTVDDPSTVAAVPKLIEGATVSATNPYAASGGVAEGYDYEQFPLYNESGPRPQTLRGFIGCDVQWQQQLNDNWSFQVTGDRYIKTFTNNFWTSENYYPVTGRYAESVPETEYETIGLSQFTSDLVGKIKTGPVNNTIQVGFDTSVESFREDDLELATTADDTSLIPETELYEDPASPDWTPFNYGLIAGGVDQLGPDGKYVERLLYHLLGSFEYASERMYFWNNRLILMGNISHNTAYENISNLVTAADHGVLDTDANTYAYGGNFKVFNNDSLVLFANKSTGFSSEAGIDEGIFSVEQPVKTSGYEAGVKSALPDEKVDFTLDWFQVTEDNVPIANPNYLNAGAGIPEYLGTGTDYVHGFTLDASTHPWEPLTVIVGLGYMPSSLVADPATPTDLGRLLTDDPVWNYGVAARYQFLDGWLKGVALGVSTTYQSAMITAYNTATSYQFIDPSMTLWNAFVNYTWKTGPVQHEVAVNFKNIFNRYYLDFGGAPYPGATVFFTYSLHL